MDAEVDGVMDKRATEIHATAMFTGRTYRSRRVRSFGTMIGASVRGRSSGRKITQNSPWGERGGAHCLGNGRVRGTRSERIYLGLPYPPMRCLRGSSFSRRGEGSHRAGTCPSGVSLSTASGRVFARRWRSSSRARPRCFTRLSTRSEPKVLPICDSEMVDPGRCRSRIPLLLVPPLVNCSTSRPGRR